MAMALLKSLFLALVLPLVVADLIPFDSWDLQTVALPDVNIFFRYAGGGPPILLVHGYPQHSIRAP